MEVWDDITASPCSPTLNIQLNQLTCNFTLNRTSNYLAIDLSLP